MCRYPVLFPDALPGAGAPEPAPELRLLHEHQLPQVPPDHQPSGQPREVRPHRTHSARHDRFPLPQTLVPLGWAQCRMKPSQSVLWVWIRSEPELFPRSGIISFGSGKNERADKFKFYF